MFVKSIVKYGQQFDITVFADSEVKLNLEQKRATSVHQLDRYKFALNPWDDSNLYYKYRDTI